MIHQDDDPLWRFSRLESYCPYQVTYVVSPHSLQHLALDVTASAILQKMLQHSGEVDDSGLDSNPKFSDYLSAHVPPPFRDTLCQTLLKHFDELWQEKACNLRYRRLYEWREPKRLANQLVHLCQSEMARIRGQPHQTVRMQNVPYQLRIGFVQQFAPLLTGLRSLDMTSMSIRYDHRLTIWPLRGALRQMPLLEEFVMHVRVENVLDVLAACCPLLRRLDISGSANITDAHVPMLAAMKRLQEVQLDGTSCTDRGYVGLLRALPQLRDMGTDSGLIQSALHQLAYNSGDWIWIMEGGLEVRTNARLELLVRSYASVFCVLIRGGGDVVDLRPLQKLTEIVDLRLVDFGFERVREALRTNGRNLRWLTLEGVDCVQSMSELVDLSVCCPVLEDLVLKCVPRKSGRWIDEPLPSPANAAPAPPIGRPEQIELAWLCGIVRLHLECENASLVEFLLSNCVHMQTVHISSRFLQTGAMVERVLARNPMSCLKMACLGPDVPLETARKVAESCGKLLFLKLTYRGEETVRERYERFSEDWRAENPDAVEIKIEDELTEMFELFEVMDDESIESNTDLRLVDLDESIESTDLRLVDLDESIESIDLRLVDFGFERVREALRTNGRNLRRLTLEGADCMKSMSELRDLSACCPVLEELVLKCVPRKSGRWIDEQLPSPANAAPAPPIGPPKQIESAWLCGIVQLHLVSENACLVEFLLSNCANLLLVSISSRLLQTGAMVKRVLARNPMSCLKLVTLGPDVPLETARKVVKSCGKLRVLELTYRGEETVRARYERFSEEWRAENPDAVEIKIEDELTEMFELFEVMDDGSV